MKRRSFIQSISALSASILPALPTCLGSLTRPLKVESVSDLFRTVETDGGLKYHIHPYDAYTDLYIPLREYKQKVDWKTDSWLLPERPFEVLNASMDKAYEYDLLKIMLSAGIDNGGKVVHSLKDYVIFGSPEFKEKYPDLDIVEVYGFGKGQMFQEYYDKDLKGVSCGEIAIAVKPDPNIFLTFQPKAGIRQFGYNIDLEIKDGKISKVFDYGRAHKPRRDSISAIQVSGSVICDSRNVHILPVDSV